MKRIFKRRLKKITVYDVLMYLFVIALATFASLPLVYLVSSAFKPLDEILRFPPLFIVRRPTLDNLRSLMFVLDSSTVPFLRYFFNSVLVTIITVVASIIVCSLGAYGLAKHSPAGARMIMNFVLAGLMFSPFVTQIPNYENVLALGLDNSYLALILPKIAVSYNFFLMERFATQIPDAIIEAARIDGASERGVFWRIAMPLLKPAWSTIVVFTFVGSWNDAFTPLVFIHKQAMKTLPLAMQTISGGLGSMDLGRYGASMASALVTTLPTIILFCIMQRNVIKTMAHSGIKA